MRDGRRVAFVVGGAVAGLAVGVVANAIADPVYRATTLLEVAPAASPEEPRPDALPVPAPVLAETYAELLSSRTFLAGIAPQVGGGRLAADELDERVEAARPGEAALVRLTAEASSPQEAQALAADVTSAFVALVQQLARQRTTQVEDELRRRIAELEPEDVGEREALLDELARAASRGVEHGTSLTVAAAPSAPDEPEGAHRWENLLGGLLLGLVAGVGTAVLRRRPREEAWTETDGEPLAVAHAQAEPKRGLSPATPTPAVGGDRALSAAEPEPESEAEPEPARPLAVRLVAPAPRSTVRGAVALRAEVTGEATLAFMASDGGPEWHAVQTPWDTRDAADGVWWLSVVARDDAGHAAASDPLPVVVDNRRA